MDLEKILKYLTECEEALHSYAYEDETYKEAYDYLASARYELQKALEDG